MKNAIILFFFALAIATTGCKKEQFSDVGSNTSTAEELQSSGWHVTYMARGDSDLTTDLKSYNFTFYTDNKAVAATNLMAVNGTWGNSIGADNADVVMLNFTTRESTEGLVAMGGNWTVMSKNNSLIAMKRVVNDSPETDYLTISKN